MQQLRPTIVILVLMTLLAGVLYPLVVTGIAQGLFSDKANGSLIERNGKAVGSELIGQPIRCPPSISGAGSARPIHRTTPVHRAARTMVR